MPKQTQQKLIFTAQQSTLNKALNIASKALGDNKIIPAHEMFLFVINGNKMDVSACDGSAIIQTGIEIQSVLPETRLLISGRKIQDYISKSANEPIEFEIQKHVVPEIRTNEIHPVSGQPYEKVTTEQITHSIIVKTKGGKCVIPCEIEKDSFPVIKNVNPISFEFPAEDLLEMFYRCMYAISGDQLRPSATGLSISIQPGSITFSALNFDLVATYTNEIAIEIDPLLELNFIIPKKALQQIQALNPVGSLSLSVSKSAISIAWGLISLTALLIDQRFPDYKAVTPTDNHIDFLTSRSALINSLKRILPFSDTDKLVKMNVQPEILLITAENIDYSEEANETIPGAITSGEPITIGANGDYLLQILNSMTDDKVWFSFSTPKRAMIITESDRHVSPSKENLVLLMPIFIAEKV